MTYNNEGIKGLYKGIPTAVLGAIPANLLYFGTYEFTKKNLLLISNFSDSEFLMYFIGGMVAETVSCLIYVPVDVIKERLQVQSNLKTYNYKNDLDAFVSILRQEKLRGIYKAYGATIMSFGPLSAFYFMFYEYFKGIFVRNDAKTYIQRIKQENVEKLKEYKLDITFKESLICSAAASAIAGIITNPLDLVKLRMQVERAGDASKNKYKNIFNGLYIVAKTEGLSGLYRGSIARAAYFTPTGAITMTAQELFKPKVRKFLED